MPEMSHPETGPRPLPCFVSIGFVGKRKFGSASVAAVRATLAEELAQLERTFPAPEFAVSGVSSLAEGADTLFAEEIARRHWLHRVFLPEPVDRFFNAQDFAQPEVSQQLLTGASVIEVRVASRQHDREERFAETGIEVAHACDILFTVCTAEEWRQANAAAGTAITPTSFHRGGTGETLHFALRAKRPVRAVILDVANGPDRVRVETSGDIASARCARPPGSFFDHRETPTALATLDYRAELAAIADAAGRQSARGKRAVHVGGGIVLGTHVFATATAAAALVFHWGNIWPAAIKALLLTAGFGCAVWLYLRRRQTQEAWVNGRLVAELCRSAQALVGSKADDEPFGGGLRHLRDFELGGEFRAFTTALHMLHLRELRRTQLLRAPGAESAIAALRQFRERYSRERIVDQISYFKGKRHSAHISGHSLEWAFFALSGLALLGAVLGVTHFQKEYTEIWELVGLKFIPLALPVAAAAIIAWIGLQDFDRRDERYAEMIALLEAQRPRFESTVSPSILRRRVHSIEHVLLQEVIEWHQRTRHQRAG